MRVTQLIARGLLCPLFTLTALVASAEMTIEVEILNSGWGTVTPESATISSGSATFVAKPKQGYKVNGWMIEPEDLQIQRNGAQVTVPYDANVNKAILTPIFTYGAYTVTFDPRGGRIDGASTITVTNKQNYANLPTPDWSGHVFKGWFDGDTQIKNGDPIWLTNDTTFCANWTTNSYKLTVARKTGVSAYYYRIANGSWQSTSSDINVDVPCGVDYAWYAEMSTGYEYEYSSEATACTDTMPVDGISYTVTPTLKTYTLTFDAGSGEVIETNGTRAATITRAMHYNERFGTLPQAYLDDQHKLKGWFDAKEGGNLFGATSTYPDFDLRLYAQWADADVYEIRGVAKPSEGGTVTGGMTTYSGREVTLEAVANTGYNFFQWDDDATAPAKRTVVVGEKGMTYTAIFTANVYRVVFNVVRPEATVSSAEKSVAFGGRYGQLPEPDCPDYEFQGWYADTDYQTSVSQDDSVNTTGKDGVITLYAKWQKIPVFFVAFDGNGATDGLMATQKIVRGVSTALTSNAFTRVGSTYDGWTDATGRAYADGVRVYNLADEDATVTLYAKWTPNKYHVIFDSNGQRGTMSPVSNCTYDVAFDLPENKFVNLTGEFLGWSMDKTATTAAWTDKASVKNLATGGTVTLYAVWKSLINDLTTAAHCKNVVLTTGGQNPFTVYTDDTDHTSVKSGLYDLSAEESKRASTLSVTVSGPGKLTFCWKADSVSSFVPYLNGGFIYKTGGGYKLLSDLNAKSADDGWYQSEMTFADDANVSNTFTINSTSRDEAKYLLVDRVVWMPEGDVVEPTEADAPTIGGFESADGGFSLSFPSDDRFDYRVLSTTSLAAPIDWKPDEKLRLEGTGGTLTFQIEGTDPARFFKVEVLARGAE